MIYVRYTSFVQQAVKVISYNRQKQSSIGILLKVLRKYVKICSKCTGEHLCRSAISIKLQSNFIEITLWHGCFPVNLLHIIEKPFYMITYGGLLLNCVQAQAYLRRCQTFMIELFEKIISNFTAFSWLLFSQNIFIRNI